MGKTAYGHCNQVLTDAINDFLVVYNLFVRLSCHTTTPQPAACFVNRDKILAGADRILQVPLVTRLGGPVDQQDFLRENQLVIRLFN